MFLALLFIHPSRMSTCFYYYGLSRQHLAPPSTPPAPNSALGVALSTVSFSSLAPCFFPPPEALEDHLIHSAEPFEVLIKAEGLFSSTCLDPQIQQEVLLSNPTLVLMFTHFIHTRLAGPPPTSSLHSLAGIRAYKYEYIYIYIYIL